MARSRNIKPGFFKNEQLAVCSCHARLLFIGLWCLADREGRLEDRPLRIKCELFPLDNVDVVSLLEELSSAGLIVRYTAEGTKCIWIPKFLEHQSPHDNEKASVLPVFDTSQVPVSERVEALATKVTSTCHQGAKRSQEGIRNQESANQRKLSRKIPENLDTKTFREAWESWVRHRREIRKPIQPTSASKQLKMLAAKGESAAIAMIEHSITNGWTGLFEPKEEPKPPTAASRIPNDYDLSVWNPNDP